MIGTNEAKSIAQKVVGSNLTASQTKDRGDAVIVYCKNNDPNAIPGGIIVAVSKTTGKTGTSITSEEEALSYI